MLARNTTSATPASSPASVRAGDGPPHNGAHRNTRRSAPCAGSDRGFAGHIQDERRASRQRRSGHDGSLPCYSLTGGAASASIPGVGPGPSRFDPPATRAAGSGQQNDVFHRPHSIPVNLQRFIPGKECRMSYELYYWPEIQGPAANSCALPWNSPESSLPGRGAPPPAA